jgi:hypothetical protein
VYVSEGSSEFYVFDVGGAELFHSSAGAGGGFKDSNNIIFNQTNIEIGKTSIFNLSTGEISEIGRGFAFDLYIPSENSILYVGGDFNGDYLEKLNLNIDRVSTINFSYAPYKYEDFMGQHLSPDASKMVMGAGGFDHRPSGIYVMIITPSEILRLR